MLSQTLSNPCSMAYNKVSLLRVEVSCSGSGAARFMTTSLSCTAKKAATVPANASNQRALDPQAAVVNTLCQLQACKGAMYASMALVILTHSRRLSRKGRPAIFYVKSGYQLGHGAILCWMACIITYMRLTASGAGVETFTCMVLVNCCALHAFAGLA